MPSRSEPSNSTSSSSASISRSALYQLQSPDGYYKYLGITKPPQSAKHSISFLATPDNDKSTEDSALDIEKIEKNYRKLSLKHHPDRPGGDAESFRLLKRAKLVLMDEKLRKEYDLLGLDLEEDQENEEHQEEEDDNEKEKVGGSGQPETVISHMGSATIAAILQLCVRTVMMGVVSTLITRYKYLLYPSILFFIYTSFRIFQAYNLKPPVATKGDIVSPLFICMAMYCMYTGRNHVDGDGSWWTWKFGFGEITIMTIFILNSITQNGTAATRPSIVATIGFAVISMICCLVIRGKIFRYGMVLLMELGLALVVIVTFPMMEMLMEEIMKEKLKKVGEKVRAYTKTLEEEMAKGRNREENFVEKVESLKKRHGNSSGGSRDID